MSAEFWASIGVSAATAGAGLWAARSARRTPRQEKRDDLAFATERLDKDIERLEKRDALRGAEVEKLGQRINDQDEAINWMRGRLRDLVGYIRTRGDEPPAQRPMSERAARVLNGIDL